MTEIFQGHLMLLFQRSIGNALFPTGRKVLQTSGHFLLCSPTHAGRGRGIKLQKWTPSKFCGRCIFRIYLKWRKFFAEGMCFLVAPRSETGDLPFVRTDKQPSCGHRQTKGSAVDTCFPENRSIVGRKSSHPIDQSSVNRIAR